MKDPVMDAIGAYIKVGTLEISSDDFTHLEALRVAKSVAVMVPRLKPFDRIWSLKLDREAGSGWLAVETFIVNERLGKTILRKRGIRLQRLELRETVGGKFAWVGADDAFIIWDDDFVPVEYVGFGTRIGAERREHEIWESQAHRVGSSRNPLDNFTRVVQDGAATDKMARHWA